MTSDGTHSYAYDDEGRIISVDSGGTGTYVYEADGLRVHRAGSEGPEDYVYDLADHAVATILPSGGAQRREVYAGNMHVATYDDLTTFFDHADWQATERVRSNVHGVSVLTCTNLPYGDDQSCVGPLDPTPTQFTGKIRDPETGLDYFGARFYASNSGRFMLPDWSAVPEAVPYADLSNPQTLNLYTYVGNNPINGVDADGHDVTQNSSGQQCGLVGVQPGTAGGSTDLRVPCDAPAGAGPQGADMYSAASDSDPQHLVPSRSGAQKDQQQSQSNEIAGRINHETLGMKDSKTENEPLASAEGKIAHVRLNGIKKWGSNEKAQKYASLVSAIESGPGYKISQQAVEKAIMEDSKGIDPTHGAIYYNMRTEGQFKHDGSFQGQSIHTYSGPYTSPGPYKYIMTYGP